MLHDFLAEGVPVVAVGAGVDAPEVKLELTLGKRGTRERLIVSINLGNFHRGLHSSVVNSLKDQLVDLDELTELKDSSIFSLRSLVTRAEERYPALLIELSFEVDLSLTMI